MENWPLEQALQSLMNFEKVSRYVPAGQGTQGSFKVESVTFPSGHAKQAADPAVDVKPAAQLRQIASVVPALAENLPLAHWVHVVEASGAYAPGPQDVQSAADEPSGLLNLVAGGQAVQAVDPGDAQCPGLQAAHCDNDVPMPSKNLPARH